MDIIVVCIEDIELARDSSHPLTFQVIVEFDVFHSIMKTRCCVKTGITSAVNTRAARIPIDKTDL